MGLIKSRVNYGEEYQFLRWEDIHFHEHPEVEIQVQEGGRAVAAHLVGGLLSEMSPGGADMWPRPGWKIQDRSDNLPEVTESLQWCFSTPLLPL